MGRENEISRYVNYFGVGALIDMRVPIYEHSSAARDVLRAILKALGAQMISLRRADTFVLIDTEAVRPDETLGITISVRCSFIHRRRC